MGRNGLILGILAVGVALGSCHQVTVMTEADAKVMADTAKYTTVSWQDTVVNFGTVNKGEQVKVSFHFRNEGSAPLIVTNVQAGCGCTVPGYTKGAIAPGGEGEVTGAFDTNQAQEGEVRKAIFATMNTRYKTRHTLIFTGVIRDMNNKKEN